MLQGLYKFSFKTVRGTGYIFTPTVEVT